jgi:hypothetical protein
MPKSRFARPLTVPIPGLADIMQSIIPFAVVGSEKTIVVGGKQVRGRQNRWGVINGMQFVALALLCSR